MRGHLWFIRRFGFWRWFAYEQERRRRDRIYGKFQPKRDGERLLRAFGATDEEIRKAKEVGLA